MSPGVAFVLHNFDHPGGMEGQAARLAERLAARGAPVTVVTTRPAGGTQALHERRAGVEIVRVPCFTWWREEAVHRFFEAAIGHVLQRRRRSVDVVYAVHYASGCHALGPARALGLPVVVKLACAGVDGDLAHLARQPDREELTRRLLGVDRVICLSGAIREEALAIGLREEQLIAIPNGVDPAFADGVAPAVLPAGRTVLFVGRLDSQKRVDVLLRAFARVLARVPDARLALAGAGPRRAEYEALARPLGDRVAFLGSRKDVPALHRAASAFVLPSASEGIPNSLLEALAAGTPSVATDIPGTRDVVRHERESLLVPVDDDEALAAALARVLTDADLAARLVAAGKERIAREYALERVTDRYLELFGALAGNGARAGSVLALDARFVRALSSGLARSAVGRLGLA